MVYGPKPRISPSLSSWRHGRYVRRRLQIQTFLGVLGVFAVGRIVVFAKSMLLVTPETSQRGSGTADRPQHCAHGCGVGRRQRHMRALAPGGGKSDLCDDRTLACAIRERVLRCAVSLGAWTGPPGLHQPQR